jgi:hypothetical protein
MGIAIEKPALDHVARWANRMNQIMEHLLF